MRWKPGVHREAGAGLAAAEWSPRRGASVQLRDLLGRKHLNGSVGVVVEGADDSLLERESRRCRVRLQDCGSVVRVLPENLAPYAPRLRAPAPRARPPRAVELPEHLALASEPAAAPARAAAPPRAPPRPRSEGPRAAAARRGRPCGEVYAAVQRSAAGRDPFRLRCLVGSFFRERPDDGHPKACSPLQRRFPEQALSARDWRRQEPRAEYRPARSLPLELGGRGEALRPADPGGQAAPGAVEGVDTFQLHSTLRQRLLAGTGCAWSRLRSGVDPSLPLDPKLEQLILREDVEATTRAVAAGRAPAGLRFDSAPPAQQFGCAATAHQRLAVPPVFSEASTTFLSLSPLTPDGSSKSSGSSDGDLSDPGVFTSDEVAHEFGEHGTTPEVDRMLGSTPDFLRQSELNNGDTPGPVAPLAAAGARRPTPRARGLSAPGAGAWAGAAARAPGPASAPGSLAAAPSGAAAAARAGSDAAYSGSFEEDY